MELRMRAVVGFGGGARWALALCVALMVAGGLGGCGDSDDAPAGTSGSDAPTASSPGSCEPEFFPPGQVPTALSPCICPDQQVSAVVGLCDVTCVCTQAGWFCNEVCREGSESGPELGFAGDPTLVLLDAAGAVVDGVDPLSDGVLPGDRLRLDVPVAVVSGDEPLGDVLVRLLNEPSALEFDGSRRTTIDVLTDEVEVVSFGFAVRANASPGVVRLELEATAAGANRAERTVTFDVRSNAALAVRGMRWRAAEDPDGEAETVLEQGRTYLLVGELEHFGDEALSDVSVEIFISPREEDFEIEERFAVLPTLAPGTTAPISARIRVRSGAEAGPVDFSLLPVAGGIQRGAEVLVPIGVAPRSGGNDDIVVGFGTPTVEVTSDNGQQRDVTIDRSATPVPTCSPELGSSDVPQDAGTAQFTFEVWSDGASLSGLSWTATASAICLESELMALVSAPATVSDGCIAAFGGCHAGAEVLSVDGPSTLGEDPQSVTVTLRLTDLTADRSFVSVTISDGVVSRRLVFDQDADHVVRP